MQVFCVSSNKHSKLLTSGQTVTELNNSLVEPSSTQTLRTITSTDLRTDTKITNYIDNEQCAVSTSRSDQLSYVPKYLRYDWTRTNIYWCSNTLLMSI